MYKLLFFLLFLPLSSCEDTVPADQAPAVKAKVYAQKPAALHTTATATATATVTGPEPEHRMYPAEYDANSTTDRLTRIEGKLDAAIVRTEKKKK